MTDLLRFRDHAAAMTTAVHRPDCQGNREDRWGRVNVWPNPNCDGCVPDAERALWGRLASEVDEYLAPQPDLFGELTAEPTAPKEDTDD